MADEVMFRALGLASGIEIVLMLIQPVRRWSRESPCWTSIWGMRERYRLSGAWCRVSHVRVQLCKFRFLGLVRRFST